MRRSLHPANRRLALAAYVVAWVVAAAACAALATSLLGRSDDDVTLPPVRAINLADAANDAHCDLRHAARGQRLNPPVDGDARSDPARAGFYDHPLQSQALVAALRRGIVVIQTAPGLDDEDTALVRTVQEAVPDGTIVASNVSGMSYAVATTAYRRLLGCRTMNARTLDAVQLFRGRFVGRGPDG